jgi:glycosyltransferase involved in cell wall biosynthesis
MVGKKYDRRLDWTEKAASFKRNESFNLIYCRAQPFVTFDLAAKLSEKFNCPLFLHFSDPLRMNSNEDELKSIEVKMLEAIKKSIGFTFTNEIGMELQGRILPILKGKPAIALYHIIPEFKAHAIVNYSTPSRAGIELVYAGTFYSGRRPDALVEAIAKISNNSFRISLTVYGDKSRELVDSIKTHSAVELVTIRPFVDNIFPILQGADLLVAVDLFGGENCYLSTKVIDYFAIDVPMLIVCELNSPSMLLLGDQEGVICVIPDAASIAAALLRFLHLRNSGHSWDWQKRDGLRRSLSGKQYATKLLDFFERTTKSNPSL